MEETMRIVEDLKKKNPLTLKLLGYPATFKNNKEVKE